MKALLGTDILAELIQPDGNPAIRADLATNVASGPSRESAGHPGETVIASN